MRIEIFGQFETTLNHQNFKLYNIQKLKKLCLKIQKQKLKNS